MKKIFLLFILLFSIECYAEDITFEWINDQYGENSKEACSYIKEDGSEGVAIKSNVCFDVYETNAKDLDKAYEAFKAKHIGLGSDYMPVTAPQQRKDKDKIHIRLIYKDVERNILFVKKNNEIHVYDHQTLYVLKEAGWVESKQVNEKLSVNVRSTKLLGHNYTNKYTNILIKNVYEHSSTTRPTVYMSFVVEKVADLHEAYQIIRDYLISREEYDIPLGQMNKIFPSYLYEDKKRLKKLAIEKTGKLTIDDHARIEIPIMSAGSLEDTMLELKVVDVGEGGEEHLVVEGYFIRYGIMEQYPAESL